MNNKPTSTTVLDPTEIAVPQTIIRAENGDVIVADETGLRMRLSDRVIEDIAMRLGKFGQSHGDMLRRDDSHDFLEDGDPASQADHLIDCIGENIDCWDVRQRNEFASFMADLPGRQGVRGFLKHLKGGGNSRTNFSPSAHHITLGCKSPVGRAMRRREGREGWLVRGAVWRMLVCADLIGLFLPVGPAAGLRVRLR